MIPNSINREHILEALKKIDIDGVPEIHQSTKFDLIFNEKHYPPKYVISLAGLFVSGEMFSHKLFSGGDEANKFLSSLGFQIISKNEQKISLIREEYNHRMDIWNKLLMEAGSTSLQPILLREFGIYGGAQGVWVDKVRTGKITDNGTGVTVGLLHTGSSYADDLSEDNILYHYPKTKRPSSRDKSEIAATKTAGELRIPVFVITYPTVNSSLRDVKLGWVQDWDDKEGIFLISFHETPKETKSVDELEEIQFEPFVNKNKKQRLVPVREGQQKFKFDLIKRYSAKCAVCQISFLELLDGAHIIPEKSSGSKDPRNGLILCVLHHRAFDTGLFVMEPNTLKIHVDSQVKDPKSLNITYDSIEHLPRKPHQEALEWSWKNWKRKHQAL